MTRYARVELERRFLLGAPPPGLGAAIAIYDRYLLGTRLRLRRMEPGRDGPVDRKLGQKVRPDPADPSRVLLTNLYLSEAEYDLLANLPAAELRKIRYPWLLGDRLVGIDVFAGPLEGLVLLEADFESEEAMAAFAAPADARAEVTHDDRFSGGTLASLPRGALAALLGEFGH